MQKTIRCLAILAAAIPIYLGAQVVPTEVDCRSSAGVTLAVYADAHFTAKKMGLDFKQIDGTSINTLQDDLARWGAEKILKDAAKDLLKPVITSYAPSWFASLFAGGGYWGWVASAAYTVYQNYIISTHVRERNYIFSAPVDGSYQIKAWVPGDWDMPCSMIKVYSHSNDTRTLEYSYDQTNSSDRTETINVSLPAGIIHVAVSVGSGTLWTHTAGHMVDAMLNSNSYLQWTIPKVPIAISNINIAPSLPTVGSTYTTTLSFSAGSISNLIDGSVTYSDYEGQAHINVMPPSIISYIPAPPPTDPPDPNTNEPDTGENNFELAAECHNLYMKPALLTAPTISGSTATFSFSRQSDYYSIHCVYYDPKLQVR